MRTRRSQEAYSLVNLRGGFRTRYFFADAWMKNAFDTRYVSVAFPYIRVRAVRVPGRSRAAADVRGVSGGDVLTPQFAWVVTPSAR